MEFRIRAAGPGDAKAIAALSKVLGYPASAAAMRRRLASVLGRDDHRVVVAEKPSGSVCGWIQAVSGTALESGLRVEIVGLVVAPRMRRLGVGRALVARAEMWAAEISAEAVVVRSNAKRAGSRRFYPSIGYVASKRQVVYRKTPGI